MQCNFYLYTNFTSSSSSTWDKFSFNNLNLPYPSNKGIEYFYSIKPITIINEDAIDYYKVHRDFTDKKIAEGRFSYLMDLDKQEKLRMNTLNNFNSILKNINNGDDNITILNYVTKSVGKNILTIEKRFLKK